MSFEDLIQVLRGFFFGKGDLATILANPAVLLVVFMLSLLGITGSLVYRERLKHAAGTFSLAVLLGVAFVFVTSSKGIPTVDPPHAPGVAFELHSGRVLIAGDIGGQGGPLEGVSQDACQKQCAANAKCVAFTFEPARRACFLKATVTSLQPWPNAVTGIRHGAPVAHTR